MKRSPIRSSFLGKIHEAGRISAREGLVGLFRSVCSYVQYHARSKWSFVYFEFPLERRIFPLNGPDSVVVRIASREDLGRIRSEIFPVLDGEWRYEKRYFDLLDDPEIKCFLAEKDGKLVHYSWVFLDALRSPMRDVPFDERKLRKGDAYIGPIFTNPSARGLIYPRVLVTILRYLKENRSADRVVLFVQGRNPSAVAFYHRLGFKAIEDAQPGTFLSGCIRQLRILLPYGRSPE